MTVEEIFSTFNARHLKPSEVAESFIWSESFGRLLQNSHTVLLGARGCGKTTLMKMLTLPALHAWNNDRATEIKANIPFFGVYISTDIYWDVKNQTYSSQLSQFGRFADVLSIFSVTTNVFSALCETFQNIIHYQEVDYSEAKETEICNLLIRAWKLPPTIPRLKFVKEALNLRVDDVNQSIQALILDPVNNKVPHHDYFNLAFESSLELVIPAFERIFEIESKRRWALCFDELEFAPVWLQEKLFTSLRSRKQYILYKLSASPILSADLEESQKQTYSATAGNDLVTIKMWGNSDNDSFSKKIIDSLLFKRFGHSNSGQFFGRNKTYYKDQDTYRQNSSFHKEMIELSKKDDSFRHFMESRKVDIYNPPWEDKDVLDTLLRKIKPIVYFRNFYLAKNHIDIAKGYRLRSRKTGELFSGIEVLIKICDGNPRWLIGLVSAILSRSTASGADLAVQFDEISKASLRFKNVMGNIPIGVGNTISLAQIVERIGEYFEKQVLGSSFQMDPRGTIEVDHSKIEVPDNLIDLIKKGISQGAFTLLESSDDSFDYDVRGKKIKLSFLFFPLYKLPLRNYPSVKLSDCLRGTQALTSGQISLF